MKEPNSKGKEKMNNEKLPQHIAIIMDGNRRWARKRRMPVKLGHKAGADALERITRYANKIGIQYVTVYAFSTENWNRSEEEVNNLMELLRNYIVDFTKKADLENIKINVIGDLTKLSDELQKSIKDCVNRTIHNTGLILNIAFNYGGRAEIVKAIKEIATEVKNGEISVDAINEMIIEKHLYTANMPEPDLMIRTSGEIRTSGFLMWQMVYTEFLFIDKYWPDFKEADLDFAIQEYQSRNRKFGAK